MHICGDEIAAFMVSLPLLGMACKWCQARWQAFKARKVTR